MQGEIPRPRSVPRHGYDETHPETMGKFAYSPREAATSSESEQNSKKDGLQECLSLPCKIAVYPSLARHKFPDVFRLNWSQCAAGVGYGSWLCFLPGLLRCAAQDIAQGSRLAALRGPRRCPGSQPLCRGCGMVREG
jgi:hypothetical protein